MQVTRLILFLCLALLLLAVSGPVWAGGPHGNYTNNTAACGQCHNTHAASGTNLIANMAAGTENSVYRVCTYCHKSGGQSKYDVVNGATSSNKTSNAGGFISTYIEGVGSTPVASKHDVNGAEGADYWAPGYSEAAENYIELTCASCHDPHSGTDRAFRNTILGQPVTPVMSIMISAGNESIRYENGWNEFCGACHVDFMVTDSGSGSVMTGVYSTRSRHRVDMDPASYAGTNSSSWTNDFLSQPSELLPLEYNGGSQQLSCMTCHFAHSTTKSSDVVFNRADGSTSGSSALLRLNNRGVCQSCHDK